MKVGILGASGYTGLELVRILLRHPEFEMAAVTSEQQAGRPLGEAFPSLRGLTELRLRGDGAGGARRTRRAGVHRAARTRRRRRAVHALREAGVPVVDLSADFRLRDLATYERWYGKHAAPAHLREAVYGLPELHREALRKTKLVAAPGCYPTSALLPLAPLLRADLIERSGIHVDSKSGVSGAGRKLEAGLPLRRARRRLPRLQAGLRAPPRARDRAGGVAAWPARRCASPSCRICCRPCAASPRRSTCGRGPARPRPRRARRSRAPTRPSPSCACCPRASEPSLRDVRGSNFCDIAFVEDARNDTWILLSTLDNLCKGASGQAVQCANLMCGFAEEAGLLDAPWVP